MLRLGLSPHQVGGYVLASALAFCGLSGASFASNTIVVTNDTGGSVMRRYAELNDLRMRGAHIQIRGICMSSCTMYLGLPNVCVSPSAVLGFHGPYRRGHSKPMSNSAAARLMAAHYPPGIRSWYLNEAQYLGSRNVARMSGARLIALGIARC